MALNTLVWRYIIRMNDNIHFNKVCTHPDMRIVFVSNSKACVIACGSDIELFKANAKKIGEILSPSDIVLCDKVFSGTKLSNIAKENNFQIVAGIKKSKKRKLNDSEILVNDIISSNRSMFNIKYYSFID